MRAIHGPSSRRNLPPTMGVSLSVMRNSCTAAQLYARSGRSVVGGVLSTTSAAVDHRGGQRIGRPDIFLAGGHPQQPLAIRDARGVDGHFVFVRLIDRFGGRCRLICLFSRCGISFPPVYPSDYQYRRRIAGALSFSDRSSGSRSRRRRSRTRYRRACCSPHPCLPTSAPSSRSKWRRRRGQRL